MAKPFRRTDLGIHGEFSNANIRALAQTRRDAGDGIPAHASAQWGFITGTITDQTDLKELSDNLEALAFFGGE